jgi:hypothetical protein
VGLAFSGGGIRSATFNLGILQGLATYHLLPKLDYLSTVSGGGYIGSWLAAWIKRSDIHTVESELAAAPPTPPAPPAAGPYHEPEPINFLRDYSNYLTPRLGILGADIWAAITAYLRNVLLNQAILIAFLAAVLLAPRFLEAWFFNLAERSPSSAALLAFSLAVSAGLLLVLALIFISLNTAYFSFSLSKQPFFTGQKWVLFSVAVPLFLAAVLASCSLWLSGLQFSWRQWAAWGAVGYFVLRLLGLFFAWLVVWLRGDRHCSGWKEEATSGLIVLLWAPQAGAFGGLLLGKLAQAFQHWTRVCPGQPNPNLSGISKVACFGAPLMVIAFLLAGVLHIGLMGLCFENQKREWWSRLTGWLLIWILMWAGLFGMALYAPLGVLLLSGWVKTKITLIGGWVISTLAGLLAGRSAATSGKASGRFPSELIAKIMPYVFVVGLLAGLSYGIHKIVVKPPAQSLSSVSRTVHVQASGEVKTDPNTASFKADIQIVSPAPVAQTRKALKAVYWNQVGNVDPLTLTGWLLVFLILSVVLAWRVDINEFSMHLLYRNRLVRCYLGATNPDRHPQRFTGFDPNDDLLLADFSNIHPVRQKEPYGGPYPILNTTLNVTHGERLAWQERKGESFVFTPRYCGFQFQEQHLDQPPGLVKAKLQPEGFRETPHYGYDDGGVYLGTAVGISGAAASPNMGYHTSPPVAFLMTVFNVRLGWWLGNPRREETWRRGGPRIGLLYLLAELFALTDDRSRYVYLSDGGHFENLAIYELVRRRCPYIIACDADADPHLQFNDLGNAIRKCRTDLGIEIRLDLSAVRPVPGGPYSRARSVLGTIHYPDGAEGKLLYIKTSLTGGEPADILSYKAQHEEFPHQTTADQWFDESQFESYRALGRFAIQSTLEKVGTPSEVEKLTAKELFDRLYWWW